MAKKLPPDPQSCESCRFFLANKTDEFGFCRRYPPKAVQADDGTETTLSAPTASTSDWCGEYQRTTH
ncbi:MAG TPA: high-potential iron-sulfur protein [Telluria sp.]|jgi:hypothetical protein